MTTMPQPGEYHATGLPLHPDVFNAWLFLYTNKDTQPPAYRNATTMTLAKMLHDMGEHKPEVLAPALLAAMPPSALKPIARMVGEDCAASVDEFARHVKTQFAYIDLASTAVQKISMGMMIAAMDSMQKKAEDTLAKIQFEDDNIEQSLGGAVHQMPDERRFVLMCDKLLGITGNIVLEQDYYTKAMAYAEFRLDYLRQLSHLRGQPQELDIIIKHLQDSAVITPVFDETDLPDTPEMRAIYAQVSRDARIKPSLLAHAVEVACLLTDSNDANLDTIAIGLLSTAMPNPTKDDDHFMRLIAGDDIMDTIQDNIDALVTDVPLSSAPLSLQHISLAQAVLALREGTQTTRKMFEDLNQETHKLSAEEKRRYASQVIQNIGLLLQDIVINLQPHAAYMNAPQLAATLKDTIAETYDALSQLRRFAVPHNNREKKSQGPGF